MSDRAYTVQELDDLRYAVETKYLFGSYRGPDSGISQVYRESEMRKAVEEQVRTHMLAGHTASVLYDSEARE